MHPLPEIVVDYVRQNLRSIEQVEILLLLLKNPGTYWTAAQIDLRIRTEPSSIQRRLVQLEKLGIVEEGEGKAYRFTEKPEIVAASETFASYYASHTTRIIEMIYSEPNAHQAFSNAFKLRSDKE